MTTHAAPATARRAGLREWFGLAVLGLPLVVLAMDTSVLYLAVPHLGNDLHPSGTETLWIMDVYGFVIAGFLVPMGALGDRFGRRRLLMVGVALFAAASLLCAYSSSASMLIGARAALGVAGAMVMPSTLALVRTMFSDPRQRTLAIAIWSVAFTCGMVAGPVVGGLLLERFWWGSVFLVGVVVAAVLVVAPVLVPEYRDAEAGRLDLISVVLSLCAILPVVYGVKEIAVGHGSPASWLAVLAGVGIGVLFVRRQRRIPHPVIDVRLFANRSLSTALILIVVGMTTFNGVNFLYPQLLQMVRGASPFHAGLWMLLVTAATAVGNIAVPFLARRARPTHVLVGGLVVSLLGFLLMTRVQPDTGMAVVMAAAVAVMLGSTPIGVLGTDIVVSAAPPEKAGAAAALTQTCAKLGVGLGIAVMGTVLTATYRHDLAASAPSTLPRGTVESARESLNDAITVSSRLPGGQGDQLLHAAKEAFTSGLNVVAIVCAALVAALVILVLVLLRGSSSRDRNTGPGAEKTTAS
ncbi:MFS transporter, DHA2 family, multidrug resistance protein [Streptoalloteichus tenebrarius]|uniref:MFS transporter, DHA2 family, multidrug resistance protein n=1 Tax=Streptoalloteichus tenebrarius (strain ATCC 17920 / DSM 40477 / JCM 4838 / CBS 697.72 / NBRC 16177 / NCIMB 11028 / NRRL B-12390 / A12253. 1 / ISP 5477) TaxID=1933 RepID=A0ABT1HWI5_STRSD|nr:MFS transporter [Streptoalloteichus tenebrarius]MCP2259790.1 MFS transporter, DHA2 family, multidrug resistance protein [Streptoalloteichus tenebrarius]BFE99264.1 MFS transporter [Streptoalloteichus tenebrarius]